MFGPFWTFFFPFSWENKERKKLLYQHESVELIQCHAVSASSREWKKIYDLPLVVRSSAIRHIGLLDWYILGKKIPHNHYSCFLSELIRKLSWWEYVKHVKSIWNIEILVPLHIHSNLFHSFGNLCGVIQELWMLQVLEYWVGRGMLQILWVTQLVSLFSSSILPINAAVLSGTF